jgi:hypothetical protein
MLTIYTFYQFEAPLFSEFVRNPGNESQPLQLIQSSPLPISRTSVKEPLQIARTPVPEELESETDWLNPF